MGANLPAGYTLKVMDAKEFFPLFEQHYDRLFGKDQTFFPDQYYSAAEKAKLKALAGNMGTPYNLHLGIFSDRQELVAFSFGAQEDEETFYVYCSAVVESERGRGLYGCLLDEILERTREQGFQKIYGTHCATNNAVIIPKLKKGFVISKFELSDVFGVVLHLTYFTNPLRRQVMDYRCGYRRPEGDVKRVMKLG